MRALRITVVGAALMAAPLPASAQSLERQIERLAESIGAAAERLASRVERQATALADRLERQLDEKRRRERRWEYERDDAQPTRSRLDTTVTFSSQGVVDLINVSGTITVTASDRQDARISAYSERGVLDYEITSSRITIEVRSDRRGYSGSGRYGDTRYEVSVPRGVRVITRTSSGDVRIRGTRGDVEVKTMSGDVEIEDVGRAEVGTLSGEVRIRGVLGDVDANAVSGNIEVEDVRGDVHLGSTSGDLYARNLQSADVEMSTTSGEVSFSGPVDPNGRYEFQSHSGNIDLGLAGSVNARLSVETYSGEIESDFPITLQPRETSAARRPRRFEFAVGSGGPRVVAETFSGDIGIRRLTSR